MPLINDSGFDSNSNHEAHLIEIDNPVPAVVTRSAFDTVCEHYLVEGKGHANLRKLIIDQLILSTVAITGAGLYATAADDYAQSVGEALAGRINYMICTCLPALVVLYNSTELFLIMRRAETIPEQLKEYLTHSSTRLQKNLEDIAITTGAAISALPLAAVSYMYPIPGFSKTLLLFQGVVVLIDNTILHLFPFKLAFSEPLYRLPSLPFEFIIRQMTNACLSQEEREKKKCQAQIDQQIQAIKQRLIEHLELGQKLLSIYGFRFLGCGYINEVKKDINEIKKSSLSPTELLIALLNLLHEMASDRDISPPGSIRKFFRTLSYIPGALWVMSSCAGFLAAPVNEMTELTGSSALGATLSTPPIYFLGVLLAFFGGNALQNTYDYFTYWNDDAVKIPMAFKLYPKTSVLLILISIYLSAFSYAAGAQLINDNFKGELEFLRPYLLNLAKTGLTFLGFTAMIDFFNNVLRKFGQFGSNEDAETVIKLTEAFGQIKNSLQQMQPDLLLESLAQMNENHLNSILNIKTENDRQNFSAILIQLAEALKTKIFRESGLINKTNIDKASLDKLLSQLDEDKDYTVDKLEALLSYLDTELKLNDLPLSLKEVCQEYKAVCELIKKIDSISLVHERNIIPYGSINAGDSDAGNSSETTPLLGSIQSRFFYPSPRYCNNRASSLSPRP
ncbi:MAG: hypothetical protein WA659_01000 [Candidatus Aquirickettsiella sp.]